MERIRHEHKILGEILKCETGVNMAIIQNWTLHKW